MFKLLLECKCSDCCLNLNVLIFVWINGNAIVAVWGNDDDNGNDKDDCTDNEGNNDDVIWWW